MRKLLVTCIISLLASVIFAQTTSRSNAVRPGSAKTTLTPTQRGSSTPAKTQARPAQSPDNRSIKPAVSSRSGNTNNNAAHTSPTSPTTQSRSTQSQNNSATTRSQSARPSATLNQNAINSNTTARNINDASKKAPEIKAVNPVRVKWMTLEEALEKSKTDKRKIFVDVYTDWCGWCKRMDSTTFMNPAVVQYLNDHYYPVKFNAEQQKEIVYKDKTYQFKKNGARGYHELAAEWLNNRLSYPTVVFLDENQGVIQPLQGYQDATKMEAVLNYFGTDSHKKTPWESYQKNFTRKGQ